MQLVNTSARYGAVSQSLHWAIAGLVVALILMGEVGDVDAEEGNALYFWHSSLGVLVMLLVIARVGWRLMSPPPRQPQTMSRLAGRLAKSMHAIFYVLLLALPISGWLVASAEGAPVSLFGAVAIPAWAGAGQEETFEEAHEILGNILLILVSLHALAALKHHFVDKDDVLLRMLPRSTKS